LVLRILGLDYGEKTIGVALSDPFGWTAQGLEIIRRPEEGAIKASIARLGEIIAEYQVEKIVLGFPKNMNNTIGPRCEKTLEFKAKLEKTFPGMEIILMDERLTTASAKRVLLEADVSRAKRKKVIDKVAASYILQAYLDSAANKA